MKKTEPSLVIQEAEARFFDAWLPLWNAYCGLPLEAEVTQETWRRILDPAVPVGALFGLIDGKVAGFLTYVVHVSTFKIEPVCYLEDLYVAKACRGDEFGVADALLRALMEKAKQKKWSRLYGITRSGNRIAQRLYNRFGKGEPYLRYVVPLSGGR